MDDELQKYMFENFIKLADKDLDERISLQELILYMASMNTRGYDEPLAINMFQEITAKRNVKVPSQINAPLNIDEIIFASIPFISQQQVV